VPNASIAVAYGAKDPDADVIALGSVGTRHPDSDQRGRTRQANATHLVLVDDAGPCGSWRSRDLTTKGHRCGVVAPALMPHTAGDRVTTDRRDAGPWARLMRAGDLTPVDVPTVADAAIRDLSRAREDAMRALKAAPCRLNACWLRHASRDTGRAPWGPAHRRWLAEVVCATSAQPLVFQASVRAVTEHPARLPRLEPALHDHGNTWRLQPVVETRQAWRAGHGGRHPRGGMGCSDAR